MDMSERKFFRFFAGNDSKGFKTHLEATKFEIFCLTSKCFRILNENDHFWPKIAIFKKRLCPQQII